MQEIELIDFININEEEIKMVYDWRNDIRIRKWMFDDELISFDKHIDFIDNLKLSTSKRIKYFLVLEDCNYLGVISFKNIDLSLKTCNIGLYSNPQKRGVGTILMSNCIDYGFNTIGLSKLMIEAFKDNTKAINLYKKMNFQETKRKIIINKEVICMELNH